MGKQKLWIVSEMFYPEETSTGHIMTELATGFTDQFDVTVLSGPSSYHLESEDGKEHTIKEIYRNVKIIRTRSVNLDKNKLLSRLFRLIWISFLLSRNVIKYVPKNSRVLLVTNPAPLLVLLSMIAKIKSLKVYLIVHDVYPDNLVAAGIISNGGLRMKFLNWLFSTSYDMCHRLVVLGRDMKEILANKTKTQIEVIPNWAQVSIIIPEFNASRKLRFIFAGNIGRVQGIETLCQVMERFKSSDKIEFIFAGSGAKLKYLKQFLINHDILNVKLLGEYKREDQSSILNMGDIGIVSLSNNMLGLGVPSKAYNLLAAGKPIFYIGNRSSEIAKLVLENNLGWFADINNLESVVNKISELADSEFDIEEIGMKCRKLAEEEFTKDIIINSYKEILSQ